MQLEAALSTLGRDATWVKGSEVITTWTELAAQPPIHRAGRRRFTDDELRAVFESIDTSGDGEICVAELKAAQHGRSAVLAAPQHGSCASSGHTWRLWAARHSQGEASPLGAQPLPRLLEPAASKATDFTAFDHAGRHPEGRPECGRQDGRENAHLRRRRRGRHSLFGRVQGNHPQRRSQALFRFQGSRGRQDSRGGLSAVDDPVVGRLVCYITVLCVI